MALSDIADLTKGYGPTVKQRERILDSVYGSVLGMATAALLCLSFYVIAVILFVRFLRDEVVSFALEDPWLFWPGLTSFPALIVICFVIPAGMKAYRERQIFNLAPAAEPVAPGYFRIQPFEAADADRFQRPDDAENRAFS